VLASAVNVKIGQTTYCFQDCNDDSYLEKLVLTLMKVSSLSAYSSAETKQAALSCSDALYQELFKWAKEKEQCSIVNNSLLVHLGLIKVKLHDLG
jgi:hypothetical protein